MLALEVADPVVPRIRVSKRRKTVAMIREVVLWGMSLVKRRLLC